MKRILAIFLMFGLWCFYLNMAQAVTINEGATVTAIPASGTVHNGTRVLDPVTKRILSESWTPFKPARMWQFKVHIVATGYGEVVLALFKKSMDMDIGDWRNGPALKAADSDTYSFTVDTLSPAYNFYMVAMIDFNTDPVINEGLASEINTGHFEMSAGGTATPRGRSIMAYGGSTASLSVGVNMTGPSTAIVVGTIENWIWASGITHPTTTDSITASLDVNVSDSDGTQCAGCNKYHDPNNTAQANLHRKVGCGATSEDSSAQGITCANKPYWNCLPHTHTFLGACSVHIPKPGTYAGHKWGTFTCRDDTHVGYLCLEPLNHRKLIARCLVTENGDRCTVRGYYACTPQHTHQFTCGYNHGFEAVGCGNPYTCNNKSAHQVKRCSNCSNYYKSCSVTTTCSGSSRGHSFQLETTF